MYEQQNFNDLVQDDLHAFYYFLFLCADGAEQALEMAGHASVRLWCLEPSAKLSKSSKKLSSYRQEAAAVGTG